MKTFNSVIFLPILIILLLVTPVFGSDWIKFEENKNYIIFYDKNSIKHISNSIVQVWCKRVFSDEGRETENQIRRKYGVWTEQYDKLSDTKNLYEINCKKGMFRIISGINYDTDGFVLDSYSNEKMEWSSMVPDTMIDSLRKKLCELGSSDWVECMKNNDGVFFYNKKRIKHRKKNIVQIWEKLDFSDEGREKWIEGKRNMELSIKGYDKLSHSIGMIEIDCKKGMSRGLSMTDYDTDGIVLYSYDNKQDWSYITPDTLIDTFRKKFCK